MSRGEAPADSDEALVSNLDGADTATKLTFLAFEFNGTQSSDPDPGDQIVNWTWNFGDGSLLAYGPVVPHNYTDHGLPFTNGNGPCRGFIATLTVRDNNGALGTDSVDACLINRPAAIPALPDILAFTGETVTLDGSGIFDPEKHPLNVKWTLSASPLNSGPDVTLFGATPQFTPTSPGTFYIALNATDDLGAGDDTYLKMVVADANAPVFSGNTIQDCAPGTPGIYVLNKPLLIQDSVISGCGPGLKVENARAVFAESQITSTATVIQVVTTATGEPGRLDIIRQDWEATTLDRQEVRTGVRPVQDVSTDTDGEGVKDFVEMYVRETNPLNATNPDRDGDGVHDHQEIAGATGTAFAVPPGGGGGPNGEAPGTLSVPGDRIPVVNEHICYIDSSGDEPVRVCPPHEKGSQGDPPCTQNCQGGGGGGTADPDFDGDGLTDGVETSNGALVWFEAEEFLSGDATKVLTDPSQNFRAGRASPDLRTLGGFPGAFAKGKTSAEVMKINSPFGGRTPGPYRVMVRAAHEGAIGVSKEMTVGVTIDGITNFHTFFIGPESAFYATGPIEVTSVVSTSISVSTPDTDKRLLIDTVSVFPAGFTGALLNPRAVDSDFDVAEDGTEVIPGTHWIEGEDFTGAGGNRFEVAHASLGAVSQSSAPARDNLVTLPQLPAGTYRMFVKALGFATLPNGEEPSFQVSVAGQLQAKVEVVSGFLWYEVPGGPVVHPGTGGFVIRIDDSTGSGLGATVQIDKIAMVPASAVRVVSDPIDVDSDVDGLADGIEYRTDFQEGEDKVRFGGALGLSGSTNVPVTDGSWTTADVSIQGEVLPWVPDLAELAPFGQTFSWQGGAVGLAVRGEIVSPVIGPIRLDASEVPRAREITGSYRLRSDTSIQQQPSISVQICTATPLGTNFRPDNCHAGGTLHPTNPALNDASDYRRYRVVVPLDQSKEDILLRFVVEIPDGQSAKAVLVSMAQLAGLDPFDLDTDSDGIGDGGEAVVNTSPFDPDTDSDGLEDGEEAGHSTSPVDPDSDDDRANDGTEVRLGLDPTDPQSGDGDGLPDGVELESFRIMVDGNEVEVSHTFFAPNGATFTGSSDPFKDDTDEDGTAAYRNNDFDEFFGIRRDASTGTELGRLEEFRTDPGHPDTDRDGLADRVARPDLLFALGEDDGITRPFHIRNDEGTTQCRDPQGNLLPTFFSTEFRKLSSSPTSSDTDGDGISDLSEMNALHTPSESDPRNLDSDRSGLPDAEELSLGRKPADGCDDPVDSDKDGIEDILDNQLFLASNCNNIADVDGDSLANGAFDPDSDGDGFNDGEEVAYWREKLNDPAGELRDIDAGGPDGFINVCDPDADGDGLFEDEEIRGWRTDIVTSIDQLIMIVNAICEEVPPTNSGDEPTKCANPPQSIDSLLSHSIVTSDPGDPDSDRDGFDDGNEFVSRSNPRGVDSDQDGIRDDEDFDPVVVDLEQPSMLLHGLHKSSGRSPSGAQGIEIDSYSATLEVEDNAGLLGISWELCVGLGARWIEGSCNGGSVRGIRSTPIDPKARSAGDYFSFIVEKGSLSDIFETAILRISSFDKHGNVGRLTVEKSSDIGVVTNAIFTALKLDLADKEGVSGAAKGGALEGLFRGFATQIRDLLSIILDPGAFLDGAQAIIDNELGFLIIQMAQGIIADVVAQEQAANIFVGISGFEEAFRIAFFAGFVLGFVIFEIIADIVGWSAASAAKTIKTGAKATRASRAVDAKLKVGKKEFSDDVQAFVAKLADSGGPFHQQYQRLIRGAYSIPDNLIRNLFEPQKICTICKIPTKLRNQVVYDKLIKELGWNDELVNKMDEVIERAENNMASAHEKTARIKRLLDIDPADVDAIRRNLRESFENRIPAEARRDIRMIDTTHKYKDLPGIERQWPSLKLGSRSATYEITSADELAKRFGQNVEEFQPRVGGGVRDSKVGGRVYDSKDFESPAEWQASFPSERSLRDELRRWEIIRDNVELDSGRGSFGGYVFASEPPLLFGIDIRAFLSAKGIETHIVAP